MATVTCRKDYTIQIGGLHVDAWWKLDETQPSNYFDSAAGYEADPYTQGGCVVTDPGIISNCAAFCSLKAGTLIVPVTGPSYVNANATGLTFCYWAWFDTGWLGDVEVSYVQDLSFPPAFYLNMGTNRPSFVFDPSGVNHDLSFTAWPIAQWFHCALVWTKASNTVKVYLNGAQLGSTITVGATPPTDQVMSLFVTRPHNNNITVSPYFKIDETGINVTTPFTASQISFLYNSGHARSYPF